MEPHERRRAPHGIDALSGHLLRPMTVADVPGVVELERRSTTEGWTATAYEHELTNNHAARYLVLEGEGGRVTGFAGLWLQFDQAHIVTVVVAPEERRQRLGQRLVVALLEIAQREGMDDCTLEVRKSNEPARALYRGLGFFEVGLRKGYYLDNNEDAIIMTTEPFTSESYRRRIAEATGVPPVPTGGD